MITPVRYAMLVVALLPAACSDGGAKPRDGGSAGSGGMGRRDAARPDGPIDAQKLDAPSELTELTVQGKVTPGSNVKVTARCGDNPEAVAMADDTGKYAITANVADCRQPLVLKFSKESYLPNLRVIQLPPPKTPLELNVPLKELNMLVCSSTQCKSNTLSFPTSAFPAAARGWDINIVGTTGADYFGGEMRDLRDRIAFLFGFGYIEAYDQAGRPVNPPTPLYIFPRVAGADLLNVGDVNPGSKWVEMAWFKLVESVGRWQLLGNSVAYLMYLYPCTNKASCGPPEGLYPLIIPHVPDPVAEPEKVEYLVPATRDQIRDIRADMLRYDCRQDGWRNAIGYGAGGCALGPAGTAGSGGGGAGGGGGGAGAGGMVPPKVSQFYVAGPLSEAGFFAFGTTVEPARRACYQVTVKDTCGTPVAGALLVGKGRYQPYRVETYTKPDGTACIEAVESEPTCPSEMTDLTCDFNQNLLGGETFWLSLTMTAPMQTPQLSMMNRENPRTMGNCDQPETCVQIAHTFTRTRCN